ncbi:MAG: GGDEF domain-containing protein [Gammaproteobacteria bacterium]|nr:GGDEF domain-containing protein [Gammaproteobacteria bacterium]
MTTPNTIPAAASGPDFRVKANLGVAICALVLLPPFSVNNFLQGRYLLGAGSAGVVVFLALNAWLSSRGRYYPLLTLAGLAPMILFFLSLALQKQGVIGALWCYPAAISFYFMLPERHAWFANGVLMALVIPQAWHTIDHAIALRFAITLLGASIFAAIFVRVIADQQSRLENQALTDFLTGLLNRTLLHDTLEHAVDQNRRTGAPMSLVSLDLDLFKEINDRHGHDAGDRVLRGVGAFLQQRARGADRVFRLGGEEFLMLLYDTAADGAGRAAEKLRSELQALPLLPEQPVTVSIGVATLQEGEEWETWIKRCDENLYRAKQAGRNRVMA